MSEMRYDDILGKFVIIPSKSNEINGKCPYCLGNENLDKPVIVALVSDGNILKKVYEHTESRDWKVRVFESEKPIVAISNGKVSNENDIAYGYHYVLALTPDHQSPCKLPIDQWINILLILQDTIKLLYTRKGVSYVAVYMNNMKNSHPHIDIITFSKIPPAIEKEAESINRSTIDNGTCPICKLTTDSGERSIFEYKNFIAICPWSSKHEYEFMIIPKRHLSHFVSLTQKDINELALVMRVTLGGLYNTLQHSNISNHDEFNLIFHLPPEKKQNKQFHWYIDVYPINKIQNVLASEFDIHINELKPEEATVELSKAARREFADLMGIR